MIVVATADFELYHEAVALLRERGVTFTTVEPGDDLPDGTSVVLAGADDRLDDLDDGVDVVAVPAAEACRGVEEALATLRGCEGRTVVGVDPGTRPGIAVLSGDVVVAVFHVPLADAVDVVREEVADAADADALVRVGDGARLQSARLVNELVADGITVELVDEAGTTPYLGTGARGLADVLAAVNIARIPGERVEGRDVEPTDGELQRIKDESRRRSERGRTIPESLARRVAAGDLSVEEALAEHRDRDEGGES